jgi:hypothetical protein
MLSVSQSLDELHSMELKMAAGRKATDHHPFTKKGLTRGRATGEG